MPTITQRNYEYAIVETDSLTRIAAKHGMEDIAGARLIWEDSHNVAMHSNANMHGTAVARQLHTGFSGGRDHYRAYNHATDWVAGQRAYDNPHWIIFYGGERLWIPNENQQNQQQDQQPDPTPPPEEVHRKITDDELLNGILPENNKIYKLTVPAYKVRIKKNDVTSQNDVFQLTGRDASNNIKFKKQLKVSEARLDNDVYEAHFSPTPQNLTYTLEMITASGTTKIIDNAPYGS